MKKFLYFLHDKLIGHGPQLPVKLLVWYENLTSSYSHLSQAGQDKLILEILNHKKNGYFVELGASNGVASSNTYVLEKKYGWDGLCIEPNKRFYKHLVKNRNCATVNAVVADEIKEVRFNNDGATGHIDSKGEIMTSKSLAQIMRENNAPKIVDYLSLDVEGYEEEVLYNFPFNEFQFQVMSIERPSDKLHEKLLEIGYHHHSTISPNGNWLDNIYTNPDLLKS